MQDDDDAPWTRHCIAPGGDCYCTIGRDGEVLYDSRDDFPINMKRFNAARQMRKILRI
jgi:hypothetical protein